MIQSQVALGYFGRELRVMDVPELSELFGNLVYRAPQDMVPALYQRRYYEDYFLLARYFSPGSILEIGTRFGYSLIAMCLGARAGRIVSIDMECYENRFDAPTQLIAQRNLAACIGAGAPQVEFIVGDSHQVEIIEGFDLIHVDGDHSEAGARDDILKFYMHLNPGGVMMIDDLDQPTVFAGCRAALAELQLPGDKIAYYPHKHGLAMLRK
jgi:predicted O-methyltransferase YrrM